MGVKKRVVWRPVAVLDLRTPEEAMRDYMKGVAEELGVDLSKPRDPNEPPLKYRVMSWQGMTVYDDRPARQRKAKHGR